MTEPRPEHASIAAAVEALVRAIEAKEAQGQDAPIGAPAEPTRPQEGLLEPHPSVVQTRASALAFEPPRPKPQFEPGPTADPSPGPAQAEPTTRQPAIPVGWAWSPTGRGPLPGLVDRQQWEALIAKEAQRQHRYGRPTAVVLAELDGLDAMVERMGPAAMNRLVLPCAGMLVSLARTSDRITRLANSRFGVLLLETDTRGAAGFAARITVAAEQWLAGSTWPIQLRVGWAGAVSSEELRRAVRDAETHLRARRG